MIKHRVHEIYNAAYKNYTPVRYDPPGRRPRCNVIVANLQQVNDILFVAEERAAAVVKLINSGYPCTRDAHGGNNNMNREESINHFNTLRLQWLMRSIFTCNTMRHGARDISIIAVFVITPRQRPARNNRNFSAARYCKLNNAAFIKLFARYKTPASSIVHEKGS